MKTIFRTYQFELQPTQEQKTLLEWTSLTNRLCNYQNTLRYRN